MSAVTQQRRSQPELGSPGVRMELVGPHESTMRAPGQAALLSFLLLFLQAASLLSLLPHPYAPITSWNPAPAPSLHGFGGP